MSGLDFITAMGDIASGLDSLPTLAAPWRYLFSPLYRRRMQARWAAMPPYRKVFDILGGVFLAAITLAVVALFVGLIVSAHSAP